MWEAQLFRRLNHLINRHQPCMPIFYLTYTSRACTASLSTFLTKRPRDNDCRITSFPAFLHLQFTPSVHDTPLNSVDIAILSDLVMTTTVEREWSWMSMNLPLRHCRHYFYWHKSRFNKPRE